MPLFVSLETASSWRSQAAREAALGPSRREKSRRTLLAAQYRLKAFFHQLLADPVNHRGAGLQGRDDPAVAPKRDHLAAPELLPDDDLLAGVDPVDPKHVLGDIQTDRGNLHLDGSPHVIRLRQSPYGTSMPGAGAVHQIITGRPRCKKDHDRWEPGNFPRKSAEVPTRSFSMAHPYDLVQSAFMYRILNVWRGQSG